MQVLTLRPFRKDNIYFRTIEEREKINTKFRGDGLSVPEKIFEGFLTYMGMVAILVM